MFTFGIIDKTQLFDPIILLIMAILFEAILGDLKFLFKFIRHPIILIGQIIAFLDKKLNREKRGEADRAVRGLIAVIVMVIASSTFGFAVLWLSLNHTLGWVFEFFLLTSLLTGRSLYNYAKAVSISLKEGLHEGRAAVSHIVGRDPGQLDSFGVARATIESVSENLSDGLIAPVFWYVLFGFPGLMVYKTVNTMDSMIGYRTTKYRSFGMAAARLDDVMNIIPARLTGLFIFLASFFVPKANPKNSFKVMMRDSNKHRSLNAGWPESAMAGALNIALAGPRKYKSSITEDPWIGDGTAKVSINDIDRALYIYFVSNLINFAWVSAMAVIRLSLTPI